MSRPRKNEQSDSHTKTKIDGARAMQKWQMIISAGIEEFIAHTGYIRPVPRVAVSKRRRIGSSKNGWQSLEALGQHPVVRMDAIISELVETVPSSDVEDFIHRDTLLPGRPERQRNMDGKQRDNDRRKRPTTTTI